MEFEQHIPDNPRGYTDDQLVEKQTLCDEMAASRPKIPHLWVQWCYDWLASKTDEERSRMIAEHKLSVAEKKDGALRDRDSTTEPVSQL